MTYLNEVLALGLSDQRLQFGSSEGVDKAGFGDDQEENLSTSKDREFICLYNSMVVSRSPNRLNVRRGASIGEPMREGLGDATHLLHDTGLPLGKSNVPTRLILNKLDLDLATLTTGLVIIIIFIVGAHTVALGAAAIGAVAGKVIVTRGKLFVKNRRHIGNKEEQIEV
jgi:hypothetical protein